MIRPLQLASPEINIRIDATIQPGGRIEARMREGRFMISINESLLTGAPKNAARSHVKSTPSS